MLIVAEADGGARLVVIFQKTQAGVERGVRGLYAGPQPVNIARQQRIEPLLNDTGKLRPHLAHIIPRLLTFPSPRHQKNAGSKCR